MLVKTTTQCYSRVIMGGSMSKIESYQDLMVWQRAMELTEEVYKLVKKLP